MELRDILAPLFKWWWLLLASTLVAAATSAVVAFQQPPVYDATVTLMIGQAIENPNPSSTDLYLGQQLASTYADIAQRAPVQEGTMRALGLTWLPEYIVRPVAQTQLLQINVTDADPLRAQVVANELANQLLLQTPTGGSQDLERQAFINQQLDDLQVSIRETLTEIESRQAELASLNSARQIADTQNQIASLQTKLNTLQGNYANMLANTQSGAVNSLTIIEPATLPSSPIGPNRGMTILTSAAVGFVLAAAAAYLLEYLDKSIKSPEEIKSISGLSMIAGIPTISGKGNDQKLVTVEKPRSPISESFRSIRTGLQFSTLDAPDLSTVLITSCSPSEGKTFIAANLAVVMAQTGKRVLLVDTDLRRPTLHRIFQVDNRLGFTDLLSEINMDDPAGLVGVLAEHTHVIQPSGLEVLTSGPLPPNPSELLSSQKMSSFLSFLKKQYDYVILDSPPALMVTDPIVISTLTDGVVIVINASRTQKSQFKRTVERLNEVQANILGVIVNNISAHMDGYYYYQYYYDNKGSASFYGYLFGDRSSSSNGRSLRDLLHLRKRKGEQSSMEMEGTHTNDGPSRE